MSENTLKTIFVFDSENADIRITATEQRLFALNTDLNNLGKGLSVGKIISDDLSLAGKSVDTFKNKVSDLSKPTFGDSLARDAEKAKTGLEAAGKGADNFKRKTEDLSKPTSGGGVSLAGKLTADFEALSKRVEETRRQFQEIAKVRLENGNIGNLSREILTAQTHSRSLAADIVKIQKELANPNRTSSITFLTASLRAAEAEADRLNRKLNSLPNNTAQGGLNGRGTANNLKLLGYQKQNLSYQINDVLTGLASGQNPTQILAQQGGQIAQIFNPAQITAFTAAYGGLVTILGAGAAAIALTYKITGDIRATAEHNLDVQTKITGELNKQRIAIKEQNQEFAQQRANAARADNFLRSVSGDTLEQLNSRRNNLEKSFEQSQNIRDSILLRKGDKSDDYKQIANTIANEQRELSDLDARIRAQKNKIYDNAFQQTNYNDSKSREDRLASEKRYADKVAEYNKKRLEDIEKTKQKVKELGKVYSETFDNLFQKRNSENPFASIFSEADKAAQSLRENLRGLSPEIQAVAEKLQQKLKADSVFNTRLENDFASLDLRTRANDLRDYKSPKIEDTDKFFKDFTADAIKQAIAANGGSSVRFNRLATGGFSQSSIENEFTTNFNRVSKADGSFGGFSQSPKTFADLTEKEKFDFLNRDNLGAQQKFGAALNLAKNRTALDDEQRSSIDRKILSLSSNLRPEQLTDYQRDQVATAAENEAKRKDDYERKAQEQRAELIKINSAVAAELKLLREKAEKDGFGAIEQTLRVITEDGVSASLQKSAKPKDTSNAYRGGTFYDEYENQ